MTQRPQTVSAYPEAVDFVEQGLNLEKTFGWKYSKQVLDLSRMHALLEMLGTPHRKYRVIHVAGTKGKGSTATAIAACLTHAGLRTGLLTSPHLVTPRERTVVDGRMIPEDDFLRIVREMQPYVEQQRRRQDEGLTRAPTYFEMLTAMAFKYFADVEVDWAAVEVGLGGRLDSTNVVSPACCAITPIGMDHTRKLGSTPDAIAGEKAGILKEGVPVVIGRQRYPDALEVLRAMADRRGCPRWEIGRDIRVRDLRPLAAPVEDPEAEVGWRFSVSTPTADYADLATPLLGAHQADNLATALGTLELAAEHGHLQPNRERYAEALSELHVPGRLEILQRRPAVILDVAHTIESVEALLEAMERHFPGRQIRLVFGCSRDKDVRSMLRLLMPRCASLTVTQATLSRAMPAAEILDAARELTLPEPVCEPDIEIDPWTALQRTLEESEPTDVVCATGSFYTAGQIREGWFADRSDRPST